jgi:beta-mannanase
LGVYDPSGSFANQSTVQIEHYFVPWRLDDAKELTAALEDAKQAKRFPLITLEPWPWEWNGMVSDTLLEDIIAGRYDPTLKRIFRVIKRETPQPVLLRFAHEMELLDLYPWSQEDGKSYIAAYRYIVNYARKLGVNNIYWVWSPAGGNVEAINYYPGEEYVDYVGVTILASQEWNVYRGVPSFKQLMSQKYWVTNFTGKPMIVAEAGVNGTDEEKLQWLEETTKSLSDFPNLQAFIYFNQGHPYNVTPINFEANWELNHHQVEALLNSWKNRFN